jgi:hypothetical protein
MRGNKMSVLSVGSQKAIHIKIRTVTGYLDFRHEHKLNEY